MFKRILALLAWVHHFRLVHGAILPPHVMFYPDNDGSQFIDPRKHSIRMIDWCYSVDFEKRTRLSSWVPAWKDMYAPELLNKSYIGPESDIYMAAKLIVYLCGSLFMPELGKVLIKCLDPDPKKRYAKANDVLEAGKRLRQRRMARRSGTISICQKRSNREDIMGGGGYSGFRHIHKLQSNTCSNRCT